MQAFTRTVIQQSIAYGNYLLWKLNHPPASKEMPKKILIVNLGFVGDVLALTPLIHHLRLQGKTIDLAVLPEMSPLFLRNTDIHAIIPFKDEVSFLKKINNRYDAVLLYWPPTPTMARLLAKANIGRRITFVLHTTLASQSLFTDLILPSFGKEHKVREIMRLLDPLMLKPRTISEQHMPMTFVLTNKEVSTTLKKFKLLPQKYLIISPGSRGKLNQKVPLPSSAVFAQVADYLISHHNCRVVLIGRQGEREMCTAIKEKCFYKKRVVNLVEKTTLLEAGALIRGARLLVSVDSGSVHLAATQRTPVVDIILEGQDVIWHPWMNKSNYSLCKGTRARLDGIDSKTIIQASKPFLD